MEIQSLGFRSEFIFLHHDGEVIDRGHYTVVRTLTNPNYFWGNLLIFEEPPQKGDYQNWNQLFAKEFPDPRIYHRTFAWDSTASAIGDPAEFVENGYKLEATAVLTAKANQIRKPKKYNSDFEIRILESEEDWRQNIELQTKTGETHMKESEWRDFATKQSVRYRAMSKSGLGHWFGAFEGKKLVASQGLFHADGVGRYQVIATDPDYRRRGIAATMVFELARHAFEKWFVKDLVMCADPGYFAIDIYKSVGFKQTLTQHGVYWWDKTRSP